MRTGQFIISVLIATTTLPMSAVAQECRYAVFELSTLGGLSSYGWTLDNFGNVVGSATLPNSDFHATVWVDGRHPVDLGTLGGEDSECHGINANRWIVGWAQTSSQRGFDGSAFLWRNGEMLNLGYLADGQLSEAYGINDLNQVVGRSTIDELGEQGTRAFLWSGGQMSALAHTADYRSTEAIAINNAGRIVGQAFSVDHTTWRPVIWESGQIIDLGTFRPDNEGVGICIDVNEAGDVVGYAAWNHFYYRAFVYHGSRKRALPSKPNWTSSYAWSINDRRQVVGAVRVEQSELQDIGCIWEWGKPVEYLNDLIPPKSNWFIGLAIHNNDAGQITGNGFRLDDREHTKGFLLTPVNATTELSDPTPGIAGVENTVTVSNVTPGATVLFLYSRHGGGTRIPGCDLQQNALQLDNPTLIGTAVANQHGVATITRPVPLIARGQTILFQAVVQNQCAISQLVVHQFD